MPVAFKKDHGQMLIESAQHSFWTSEYEYISFFAKEYEYNYPLRDMDLVQI